MLFGWFLLSLLLGGAFLSPFFTGSLTGTCGLDCSVLYHNLNDVYTTPANVSCLETCVQPSLIHTFLVPWGWSVCHRPGAPARSTHQPRGVGNKPCSPLLPGSGHLRRDPAEVPGLLPAPCSPKVRRVGGPGPRGCGHAEASPSQCFSHLPPHVHSQGVQSKSLVP